MTFAVRRDGFVTGVRTLTVRKKKSPKVSGMRCLFAGAKASASRT